MPNILRSFRVDPTLWEMAKSKASTDDKSLTSVIAAALETYITQASVEGSTSLPVGDRDADWDGQAALERVFELATDDEGVVDTDLVAKAFLWRDNDADPTLKGSYHLGFADVVDGALTIIPAGVAAAAARLDQTDLPDDAVDDVAERICDLYDTIRDVFEDWPDCPLDDDDDTPLAAAASGPSAAIIGHGTLLTASEDDDTKAAVRKVREYLATGAVAVSIGADMDPDSMPDKDVLDQLLADEDFEELEKLLADVPFRIRHVAFEDTAAFADARMVLSEDGSVDGPITFEGIWTGDMRFFPVGSLVWENVLPITLKLGHDGPVVGSVHAIERVDGEVTAARPATVPADAVAAAAGRGHHTYPARWFRSQELRCATPLTVSTPDASGLRHVYGHIAPHGVCHRSDMAPCFTYPGDVDANHAGFHTGASITLDDGTELRVGALTLGGSHINPALARQGVRAREVNAHRDDANTIFAMGRVYEDQYGLVFTGVVMPDVNDSMIMRAQACAPSVELWPEKGGRTVVGAHLVPTPAWPVAASMGSSVELAGSDSVVVELEAVHDLSDVRESLARIEYALATLALDSLTDVPEPD